MSVHAHTISRSILSVAIAFGLSLCCCNLRAISTSLRAMSTSGNTTIESNCGHNHDLRHETCDRTTVPEKAPEHGHLACSCAADMKILVKAEMSLPALVCIGTLDFHLEPMKGSIRTAQLSVAYGATTCRSLLGQHCALTV